jgi:2-polyprenyl-6-hydroxyphenyl methylase/3-demethylubiquinone-9 3-methyltransferase
LTSSTKDLADISRFEKLASEWWDVNGPFKLLHEMNPIRIGYAKNNICKALNINDKKLKPFSGLDFLDVGCGGGLVSVPMHFLGANVTGIDPGIKNIEAAKAYAKRKDLPINFISATAEELEKTGAKFDVILAIEVIEHVANYKFFLKKLASMLKPNGVLIITTLNRTIKSLLFAKVAAEYLFRILPAGTHEWDKFLKPEEIENELKAYGINKVNICGTQFNIINREFSFCSNTDITYSMTFVKERIEKN